MNSNPDRGARPWLANERAKLVVACAVFLVTACSDLTEPVQQPQEIEDIAFETKVWWAASPPEGILTVGAWAADPAFRATERTRLPLAVRTSAGDAEQATFKKALCGRDPDRAPWICDEIVIDMDEGFSVQDLHPRLRDLEGRYTTPPSIGRFAGVHLFAISLDDAIRTVSRWPGVKRVEPSFVFQAPWSTRPWDEWLGRALGASIKLDVASPIVGNGIIELLEGDTLTVRYVQPDSTVYTKSFYFPPRPATSTTPWTSNEHGIVPTDPRGSAAPAAPLTPARSRHQSRNGHHWSKATSLDTRTRFSNCA